MTNIKCFNDKYFQILKYLLKKHGFIQKQVLFKIDNRSYGLDVSFSTDLVLKLYLHLEIFE